MAAPNMVALTLLLTDTKHFDATDTAADMFSAVASDRGILIEGLIALNKSSTALGWITVWQRKGGVDELVTDQERVSPKRKVDVLMGRSIYLAEGDSLKVQANANDMFHLWAPHGLYGSI